jgi:hypothetical protein
MALIYVLCIPLKEKFVLLYLHLWMVTDEGKTLHGKVMSVWMGQTLKISKSVRELIDQFMP